MSVLTELTSPVAVLTKAMLMIMALISGNAMEKRLIMTAAFLAVLVSGCNKVIPPEVTGLSDKEEAFKPTVTLTASAVTKEADALTKIAFGTEDATWEEGDQIFLIKNDGTTITLSLEEGAGESSGRFISTDPVVAGSYIPYAVSATSLSKGYVSVSGGTITLNLENPGGETLADVMEHDILKGNAVTLTEGQSQATITGLTTHLLSFLRFRFQCTAKAIESIGMDSAGGVYTAVNIAPNGTVTGSASSTGKFFTSASDGGNGIYAGYFAVYNKTATSLMAHATDEDGQGYSRLVSVKEANYEAGKVYGKTIFLSEDMVTCGATGSFSSQNWKNLGLSVKWAEFNVGSSTEYSYDRNIDNGTSNSAGLGIPAGWGGWRIPSRAEVQELFYASDREWVTGNNNGVKFNCNDNYVAMGAGGYERWRDDGQDWNYNIGSTVYFYINENTPSNGWYAQIWAVVGGEGNTLGFGSANLGNNTFGFSNHAAMRLVNDYNVLESEGESDKFILGVDSYDIDDFETE